MPPAHFKKGLTAFSSVRLYRVLLASVGFSAEEGIIHILPTIVASLILCSEHKTATLLCEIPHLSAASLADIYSIKISHVFRAFTCIILYSIARIIAIPFQNKTSVKYKKGFCPKQGKSLKNYAILEVSCKPGGTISSVAKHVFEKKCCKSVAKTVVQKVSSPETRINTGFFGTSKPRGTIPTRRCRGVWRLCHKLRDLRVLPRL